jgi:hypothetical protein
MRRRRGEEMVENKIGEFLVLIGAMTQSQVEDVLRIQREGDKRMFGEINDEAIQKYIEYKHKQPH